MITLYTSYVSMLFKKREQKARNW